MAKTRLSLENINKTINDKKILLDINFNIESAEIVGLLGPNGAGKTSVFYIAAGIIFPDSGKIKIDDAEVSNLPMHVRSNIGLSYLPQEASIFQDLTVQENLLGIAELKIKDISEREKFIDLISSEFNLHEILKLKGRILSGGQRRKVEIARTLACNPRILLLDEPFAGIDPIAVEEIKELLSKIVARDISILITDHNIRETQSLCNRALIISEGKIIAEGSSEELINNSLVQKTYLGNMYS